MNLQIGEGLSVLSGNPCDTESRSHVDITRCFQQAATPWKYPTDPEDVEKQRIINRIADVLETRATEYD